MPENEYTQHPAGIIAVKTSTAERNMYFSVLFANAMEIRVFFPETG